MGFYSVLSTQDSALERRDADLRVWTLDAY